MKASSLTGILEDGLTLGTNRMTRWDTDGWVWASSCPVDGEIVIRYCKEKS